MEASIVEKEGFMVVGMTLQTLLEDEREQRNIPKLFDAFEKRIQEIEDRLNDNAIGVFIDPQNYQYEKDLFTWIAGVEVSNIDHIPAGMESFIFQPNTYASTLYNGPKNQAYTAYDYLYNWIDNSMYELAHTYGIELYEPNADDEKIVINLLLPVKKIRD